MNSILKKNTLNKAYHIGIYKKRNKEYDQMNIKKYRSAYPDKSTFLRPPLPNYKGLNSKNQLNPLGP